MKISFIATVYNEEKTIAPFIESIFAQTKMPDEIVIVDGGSTDTTVDVIARSFKTTKQSEQDVTKNKRLLHFVRKDEKTTKIQIITKKGNRSVGRNEAIKHATGDIIVCSDAGNILDKNWVRNITEPFEDLKTSPQTSPKRRGNYLVDVVAGYYHGVAKNVFQKCVIPYVLVMPDKVNPKNFLPATRSVAFTKAIWKKVGGFNEGLSHNEDYAFAKALQKAKTKIIFKRDAIVYWQPRSTLREVFIMIYRFAYGDAEARIWRPKVLFLFVRYVVCLLLFIISLVIQSAFLFGILVILFFVYLLWAVLKNYKYANTYQAIFILPALQLVADWAILKGTIVGFLRRKISY